MQPLAQRLTSLSPPSPRMRWLHDPSDEAQLIALLTACYADSYKNAALYLPDTFRTLWRDGRLASLGIFTDAGRLIGHTGLWFKDPLSDSIESGLSLLDPAARLAPQRADEAALWAWLLPALSSLAPLLHQHVTTLHTAAQTYATQRMRASLGGLIPAYVAGERVIGLNERGDTMHALSLTTWLSPCPNPLICLPDGPHATWLAQRAADLGLEPQITAWQAVRSAPARVEDLEQIAGLGMVRRRVHADDRAAPLAHADARLDLVHLPATPHDVAALTGPLYAAGYLPAAIRPGVKRPHDLIWWRGQAPAHLIDHMMLARNEWKPVVQAWSQLCAPPL